MIPVTQAIPALNVSVSCFSFLFFTQLCPRPLPTSPLALPLFSQRYAHSLAATEIALRQTHARVPQVTLVMVALLVRLAFFSMEKVAPATISKEIE
jgi:hypothetical protein